MTTPSPELEPAQLAGGPALGESLRLHRIDLETLLQQALEELGGIWRSLTGRPPRDFRDGLFVAVPPLAEEFGSAAATLGTDWYDEMRELAAVEGRFRGVPAELPTEGRIDSLLGWGTQPLFPDDPQTVPDFGTSEALVAGGFQRYVADMDRDSVQASLAADPQALGWARQTTGESCEFCVMLAGRGAVYSAETADFGSHDNCDCVCVPVFGGDPRKVQAYTPSQRRRGRPARKRAAAEPARDIDAGRTVAQMRDTLASLERSLQRFDSPGTRARIAELRRRIAARG